MFFVNDMFDGENMVFDFHTHILPSIDDGSRSVEMSIEMLKTEFLQGIRTVVLTPHFYANHDSPVEFLRRRERAFSKLMSAVEDINDIPKMLIGAEVHYFEGISDCESLDGLAIEQTNAILVEMPMRKWTDRMLYELEGIYQKRKLQPIIAHVDRYMGCFKTNGVIEGLCDLPVIVQANASFFINRLSRRLALKLLSQHKIQFLGSDCHNVTERVPNLGNAVEIILSALGQESIGYINSNENNIFVK